MPAKLFHKFLEDSSLIRHYLWKYRGLVAIGLATLVLVDALEVLPPFFLKRAVDIAIEGEKNHELLKIAVAYIGVAVIQAFCRYGWRMYLIRTSLFAGRDLREKFAGKLFSLSSSFYDKHRIGDLMSLSTNDVDAIRMAIGAGLLTFADAMFYFMIVPVAMYALSPQLTALAFLSLPIVPFLVVRNEREVHARFEKVQDQFATMAAQAQEALNGMRVVKAFAREDRQIARFATQAEEYVRLSLRLARVQTAFGPTLDFTMSLGLVALLWIGGGYVISDAVSLGTFVAFQRYIQKMIWPMAALGMALSTYQRSVASSGRMKEITRILPDVPEPETPILPQDYKVGPPEAPWRTRGAVEFKNFTFAFPTGAKPVLKGISLRVEPGERLAVVGMIGSGKSALLSALPRLYPVPRATLLIDGVDVCDWPLDELRRQVGYVGQDVFLFSETVWENIGFGLHEWVESHARNTSIEEAARMAAMQDDVRSLIEGPRTRLGERGVNLSGGQKQRLTIARALAKRPSILVLDDALSSVDVQTEERILSGLRGRAGRNTELVAAHRISTVKDADRIMVLEKGEIRQLGTHTQLMAERKGAYRKFFEQQQLKEDLEQYIGSLDDKPEVRA